MRLVPSRRRGLAALVGLTTIAALMVTGVPANADAGDPRSANRACGLSSNLVPNCGLLWGVYTDVAAGRNPYTTVTDIEEDVGRPMDIVRRYHDFSGKGIPGVFPDEFERQLTADGERILFLGWTTRLHNSQTRITWPAITSGKYDESIIRPAARRLKEWGKPVFLDFDHEAESPKRQPTQGSGWDYIQAWRHIYRIFQQEQVNNVTWVWVHVGWLGHQYRVKNFYPGDAYVDWIGYDPFNYYYCKQNPWRSPGEAIGPWYNWLMQNGFTDKPIMLGEYGTSRDPEKPGAQAQWYRNLPQALMKYPRIKAVTQFNTFKKCDTRVTTSLEVLTAWGEAGRDPYVYMHR